MKVTQPDSRSITIIAEDSGMKVFVPYRFFWNGHERQAESIVLTAATPARGAPGRATSRAWDVRAFFLFGEIRDHLFEDAAGITLHRTWLVKTQGSVHLSIELEMVPGSDLRWLFPGVHAGDGIPSPTISFLGEKTSAPSAVYLSAGGTGACLFSRTAWSQGSPAGIGMGRTEIEDEEPRLRVEVRFPGIEEPRGRIGPRPDQHAAAEEETIQSPGSIERSHELFMAFAPTEVLTLRGAAAAVVRLMPRTGTAPAPFKENARLASALEAALPGHLLEEGGVAGIRENPGSPWLSSFAGAGLAVAIRRLFPGDERLQELALRLADFSLKGQVSAGFFYESFHVTTGQWQGVRGKTGSPLLSLGQSAAIAEMLLVLAGDLQEAGLPYEKYYLAGVRFVEFFLDDKARLSMPGSLHGPADREPLPQTEGALGGLELFIPMARVLEKTGKDRYRKALDVLVRRFSAVPWDAFRPPSSRDGRAPDAAGALLAARLFLAMRSRGYHPAEPTTSSAAATRARAAESVRVFASLLVPWVRVHQPQDGAGALPGCLVDSYSCQRALFRGYETTLLLMRLRTLTAEPPLKALLRDLARLCLDAARGAPIGSSFIQHTRWDAEGKPAEGRGKRGPVDGRRLATEILAALEIAAEFPRI